MKETEKLRKLVKRYYRAGIYRDCLNEIANTTKEDKKFEEMYSIDKKEAIRTSISERLDMILDVLESDTINDDRIIYTMVRELLETCGKILTELDIEVNSDEFNIVYENCIRRLKDDPNYEGGVNPENIIKIMSTTFYGDPHHLYWADINLDEDEWDYYHEDDDEDDYDDDDEDDYENDWDCYDDDDYDDFDDE